MDVDGGHRIEFPPTPYHLSSTAHVRATIRACHSWTYGDMVNYCLSRACEGGPAGEDGRK